MGHAPQQPLAARCDSFVVETDVHYPTDVSLLWDALRCMLRSVAAACGLRGVRGWPQKRRWLLKMKPLSHRVHSSNQRAKRPQRAELYVRQAVQLAERARVSLEALESAGCAEATRSEIMTYVDLVEGLAGQVRRRVLEGETIRQEENVFSIFTPHTRWCAKGKAHPAVESSINIWSAAGWTGYESRGRGLRAHGVAGAVGGEPAPDRMFGTEWEAQSLAAQWTSQSSLGLNGGVRQRIGNQSLEL